MPETGRDPASYTDPNGYVFWRDGQVRRRIYPEKAAFVRALLAEPAFAALMKEGKLAATAIVEDGDDGLVLGHQTIWPRTYPVEWPPGMLREAAKLILEVARRAAEADHLLADGHPWNVLFDGPRPVFIDVGSLTKAEGALLWPAQAQFDRLARYPLHLWAAGLGEVARGRLGDLAQGVGPSLLLRLLPTGYRLARPKLTFALLAHRAAEAATAGPQGRAVAQPRAVDPDLLKRIRPGYFRGLERELDGLRFAGDSGWVDYYASCPSMQADEEAAKQRLMAGLYAELAPATVIDLGANTGRYAKLAAQAGARVVALDQDAASMDRLWREVRAENLAVLPLVMDLGAPTPASGWCAEQRPDALTRLTSDLAIMLALIHHLVFTGNASLQQVARLAGRAGRKHAIVEWVGPEDAMSLHLRRTATKDFGFYTLDCLTAALGAEGFDVRALEPHAPHRRLLVCTRRAG